MSCGQEPAYSEWRKRCFHIQGVYDPPLLNEVQTTATLRRSLTRRRADPVSSYMR